MEDEGTSFFHPVLGDGRPLLLAVAGSLVFAGGFALFLAATGELLPHDIHYLGMSAADLCGSLRVGSWTSWCMTAPPLAGRSWAWACSTRG